MNIQIKILLLPILLTKTIIPLLRPNTVVPPSLTTYQSPSVLTRHSVWGPWSPRPCWSPSGHVRGRSSASVALMDTGLMAGVCVEGEERGNAEWQVRMWWEGGFVVDSEGLWGFGRGKEGRWICEQGKKNGTVVCKQRKNEESIRKWMGRSLLMGG